MKRGREEEVTSERRVGRKEDGGERERREEAGEKRMSRNEMERRDKGRKERKGIMIKGRLETA